MGRHFDPSSGLVWNGFRSYDICDLRRRELGDNVGPGQFLSQSTTRKNVCLLFSLLSDLSIEWNRLADTSNASIYSIFQLFITANDTNRFVIILILNIE